MKWLKSTTQKQWTVKGMIIPACVTPHNDYLKVEDSVYAEISKEAVIKSLIAAGSLLVLNEEPVELRNSIDNLQASKLQLQKQNQELQAELDALKNAKGQNVDIEAIKAEAIAAFKEEAIKELQAKQDELDAAEKKIAKLEKQLAKSAE